MRAAVFDLGGVLIDWNPRHLYRALFDDEAAMESFLRDVCSPAWNAELDAGRPFGPAVEALAAEHPDLRELVVAYDRRWGEMVAGPIDDAVLLLAELRRAGVRLFALSNWSAEKYAITKPRFAFLDWFEAIVISGDLGVCKPDPRIFVHAIETHRIEPATTLFVDDHESNVRAAAGLGFIARRFVGAAELRRELVDLGVLAAAAPVSQDG
ncbi:MAG TPA: HAD family phosphatase [Candidatus Limnocylindrales bacterium]